jgi:undecaprenyl-diphosphatase
MFWQNVHHLDQQITLTINNWNSAFTDPIWAFLSMKLVWVPLYAAILALIIWKLGWKKGGILVLGTVLTIVFCDQFANLIKHSVARIRPLHDEFMVSNGLNILELGGGYSFFSAHAANSFGLAAVTWMGLKRSLPCSGSLNGTLDKNARLIKWYGWFMFTWAALVGISRIFVGKHYLGDVLVGAIVGLIIGYTLGVIASKLYPFFTKN